MAVRSFDWLTFSLRSFGTAALSSHVYKVVQRYPDCAQRAVLHSTRASLRPDHQPVAYGSTSVLRLRELASFLVGVLCTIGFLLIGVPYALLFGVVAGTLEFIPLVGPFGVALGATLVASFHSLDQAMWVVAFLGALRLAQDYVVSYVVASTCIPWA